MTARPRNRLPTEEFSLARLAKMSLEYDPRRPMKPEEYELLKQSLEEHGPVDPLICNRRSVRAGWPKRSAPVLVGGHKRVIVARELGWKTFPIAWLDVDELHEREVNTVLNHHAADFDAQLEAIALQAMRDLGLEDFGPAGYTNESVDAILREATNDIDEAGGDFSDVDESTNLKCPKCGYEWAE